MQQQKYVFNLCGQPEYIRAIGQSNRVLANKVLANKVLSNRVLADRVLANRVVELVKNFRQVGKDA